MFDFLFAEVEMVWITECNEVILFRWKRKKQFAQAKTSFLFAEVEMVWITECNEVILFRWKRKKQFAQAKSSFLFAKAGESGSPNAMR